jgi:ubiquinone/menaquinone biosynthesis C-methylase UbiE
MEISKVKKVWNTADLATTRNVSWLSVPCFGLDAVMEYMGADFSNDLSQSMHNILLKRPGVNAERLTGLAVACGDMTGELTIFNSKIASFYEIDGMDVSDVSLNKAIQNVKTAGIKFNPVLADCNNLKLPENHYDTIVGHSAIHHIENLENLFSQIAGSLKPGGLFYCFEYIGPNYIQVSLRNRMLAAILVNLLVWPPARRITHENKSKLIIRNINFKQIDPSEAVRSSEIIKIATDHLNILKLHMFGGLNYPAFEGIGQHFTNCDGDVKLAKRFLKIEKIVTGMRLIKPLFCFMLAEKKQSS